MEKCIIIYIKALRCSMFTLQPQGPPQSGHTNHTEKHLRPRRPTPTNKAPSTPNTGTRREQALSHPPVHTTPTHQHPPACSGQRYAKAAHTDKHRGAKPTSQSSVHTGSTRSPPSVVAHPSGHEHRPVQSSQPPLENPKTPRQTENVPMVKEPKWS